MTYKLLGRMDRPVWDKDVQPLLAKVPNQLDDVPTIEIEKFDENNVLLAKLPHLNHKLAFNFITC